MRKIPFRNYLFVLIILVVTVIAAYDIVDRFKDDSQATKNTVLTEIKENELDEYITERTEAVIYISSDKDQKEINDEVSKYFKKHNLVDKAVYLDSDEVTEDFIKAFSKKYQKEIDISYPIVIIIENNKVTKVIRINNARNANELLKSIGDVQ